MDKITVIITLVCLVAILLAFILYFVVKAIKNKWVTKLYETLKISMKEAEEKYDSGHGDDKKKYVLDAMEKKAEELGIPWKMLVSTISKLINTIISNYNMLIK